jgi:hypothetical protein
MHTSNQSVHEPHWLLCRSVTPREVDTCQPGQVMFYFVDTRSASVRAGVKRISRSGGQAFGHHVCSTGTGSRPLGGRRNLGAAKRGETKAREESLGSCGEQIYHFNPMLAGQVEGSEDKSLAQAVAAQVRGNCDRAEQSDGAVTFQARAAHQVLAVPCDQHRAEV